MRYSIISIAAILALVPAALGHTWIEEMRIIDSTGTFTGDAGFMRNYLPRGTETNGPYDFAVQNKVAKGGGAGATVFSPDAPMCKHFIGQSESSPALKASPGDMVALLYRENGHVSAPLPEKPKGGGTIWVYGTSEPKADDKLTAIWKQWTVDGKGGDGRGFLLATRIFDDGQCHEFKTKGTNTIVDERRDANDEPDNSELFCQTDITLPANLPVGKSFTIYWVWDFSTMVAPEYTAVAAEEIYTTCMDIDIVEGPGTSNNLEFSQTNVTIAAMKAQLFEPFLVEIPQEGAVKGTGKKPVTLPPGSGAVPANGAEALPKSLELESSSSTTVASTTSTPQETQPEPTPSVTTLAPGEVPFTPGVGPVPAVTVTVTKDGPTSFATVYIAVGSSFVPGQDSATANPDAGTQGTSSAVEASSTAQTSSQAAAETGRPSVSPFYTESSVKTDSPTSSTQTPTSISTTDVPTATSVDAASTTVSPAVPATTEAPQQTDEVLLTVTAEATITEFQTITTSLAKAFATTSVESPQPTLSETQSYSNGTMTARSLPRMRRVRRAL